MNCGMTVESSEEDEFRERDSPGARIPEVRGSHHCAMATLGRRCAEAHRKGFSQQ